MFIDADSKQIETSHEVGVDIVELHTGRYPDCNVSDRRDEYERIVEGVKLASEVGLQMNAGHGLHYQNIQAIAAIKEIQCLN